MLAYWSSSVNDVPFGLASIHYSNLGMTMFMPLTKLSPVISRPCIGLLCWFGLSMGLCFTQSLCPWSGWIFLRLYPVLCFRQIYLRFIIRFSFLSRKAYERYILMSKDFTRPCLLASRGSFWMNVQKMKDSHTTMHILENTSYIYIYIYIWNSKLMQTFVHRYGTCSRASTLENKHTQTRPRIAQKWSTNVLSRGLLKHSNIK